MFPHAWVSPGGLVYKGYHLDTAAIRRLVEETGIVVHRERDAEGDIVFIQNSKPCHFEPFLLYESTGATKHEDMPMTK